MTNESEKDIKKDEAKESKDEQTDTGRCCCYIADPCGCYVDPCGCYVEPCCC